MTQDVSTKERIREPLTAPPPIQPWSAEAEADRLMDELFSDIDRILDGGSRLPTEPAKPEYISLRSLAIPKIPLPSVAMPPEKLQEQSITESVDAKPVESLEADVTPKDDSTLAKRSGGQTWAKLLMVGGLASVVVVGGLASVVVTIVLLLTKLSQQTEPSLLNVFGSPSARQTTLSAADAQFINYMLRSLEVIDSKATANQQPTTATGGTDNTNNQQTATASGNRPPASQAPNVLERVYIPIPMPQTPSALPVPAPAVQPPVRLAPPPVRPSITLPSSPAKPSQQARVSAPARTSVRLAPPPVRPSLQARTSTPARPSPQARASASARPSPQARASASARPSPQARASAPSPSRSPARARQLPAPTSPQAAAPTPVRQLPPPASVAIPNLPAPPSVAAAPRHTLVGLLELGDRSAALFEVDGVTQRIYVGEAIGDSGWTLVSVANNEAVIRRNGEVRSVYLEQKF